MGNDASGHVPGTAAIPGASEDQPSTSLHPPVPHFLTEQIVRRVNASPLPDRRSALLSQPQGLEAPQYLPQQHSLHRWGEPAASSSSNLNSSGSGSDAGALAQYWTERQHYSTALRPSVNQCAMDQLACVPAAAAAGKDPPFEAHEKMPGLLNSSHVLKPSVDSSMHHAVMQPPAAATIHTAGRDLLCSSVSGRDYLLPLRGGIQSPMHGHSVSVMPGCGIDTLLLAAGGQASISAPLLGVQQGGDSGGALMEAVGHSPHTMAGTSGAALQAVMRAPVRTLAGAFPAPSSAGGGALVRDAAAAAQLEAMFSQGLDDVSTALSGLEGKGLLGGPVAVPGRQPSLQESLEHMSREVLLREGIGTQMTVQGDGNGWRHWVGREENVEHECREDLRPAGKKIFKERRRRRRIE